MSTVTPMKPDTVPPENDTDDGNIKAHVSRALGIADCLWAVTANDAVSDLADGSLEWALQSIMHELWAAQELLNKPRWAEVRHG